MFLSPESEGAESLVREHLESIPDRDTLLDVASRNIVAKRRIGERLSLWARLVGMIVGAAPGTQPGDLEAETILRGWAMAERVVRANSVIVVIHPGHPDEGYLVSYGKPGDVQWGLGTLATIHGLEPGIYEVRKVDEIALHGDE
jgi:hypothetical protein